MLFRNVTNIVEMLFGEPNLKQHELVPFETSIHHEIAKLHFPFNNRLQKGKNVLAQAITYKQLPR